MQASELIKKIYKPQPNALKVISLGWGVQSFTLAAMVALGEIEPVDFAIHADTTHEASWTYDFADRWTPWLEAHGVKVATVKPDKEHREVVDRWGGFLIPAYTPSKNGIGIMKRQCTGKWKIQPIRRYVQQIREGRPIEMWLGITTDEINRVKESNVKYIQHRWPLLERNMSRYQCKNWLKEQGLDIPSRSSCAFCPYHNIDDWREVLASEVDRKTAIMVDNAIRKIYPHNDMFLHRSLVPIEKLDIYTPSELGQMSLWDNECDGICGV